MRKLYLSLVLLLTFSIGNIFAQPVATEEFEYTVGDLLTAHGYTNNTGTSNFIAVIAGNLTYPVYPSAGLGGMIKLFNTGEDVYKPLSAPISTGTVYASFLVNFDSAQTLGDYFFHLISDPFSTSYRARVFVKKALNGNLAFGLSKGTVSATNPAVYGDSIYTVGTTYLLVVAYEIIDGTSNDVVKLWVNPSLAGPEPTPLLNLTDATQTDISVGSYAFRQGGSASGPYLKLDGLIVGTSWNNIISQSNYLIDQNFESITASGDPIPGWTFNNAQTWLLAGYGHNSDKYAGWGEVSSTDHSITSTMVTNPGTLTFWVAAYNNSTNLQVKVQVSSNGVDWIDKATFSSAGAGGDIGLDFILKTVPVQLAGNYYIRWTTASYVSGGFYLDDILLDNVVPVELTSFYAKVNGTSVSLLWSTSTETNNNGFEVQRKSGEDFVTIGFIRGYGTTTEKQNYSFTDSKLAVGSYLYRLKQVDFDGSYEYSKVIEADVVTPNNFELMQNYPNPFNPSTTINFNLPKAGNVKLAVYNLLGQEVQILVNGFKEAGVHTVNFEAANLNSGIYLYKIETNGLTSVRKMTLLK